MHLQSADDRRPAAVTPQVVQVPGGVGRNIAEAAHHMLSQAGQQQPGGSGVLLISVIGQDAAGDALLASFQHTG